jgi:osmotically inducible protein OsmC
MAKVLYTAEADVSGGREHGHGKTSDGAVEVELRPPGTEEGSATNPEQLFAIGYGACFEGAVQAVARRERIELAETSVHSTVNLITGEDRGYGLSVKLDVKLAGLEDEAAKKLVQQAHGVCPYSNATRGNVEVTLLANGQPVD